MRNFFNSINKEENKKEVLFKVVLTLLLLSFSFQGIDVCDEGWYLSFYQQFFNAPKSVEYNFAFWLTGLIGGLWNLLFGKVGILAFRILTVLIFLLGASLVIKTLKPYVKQHIIFVGLVLVILLNDYGYVLFYYNHLSGILAILSCLLLAKAISKSNYIYVFLSGFVVALNVFSRIPNLTLFVLVTAFPVSAILSDTFRKFEWIKQCFVFFLGTSFAFLIIYAGLLALDHLDVFMTSMETLFNKGKNGDSNHNVFKMFFVYKRNYLNVFKAGLQFSFAFVLSAMLINYFKKYRFVNYVITVCAAILFYSLIGKSLYIFVFLGLLSTILVFIYKDLFSRIFKLLTYMSFVVMVFLPLGSDGGIDTAGYIAVWLMLPIALQSCYRIFKAPNFLHKLKINYKNPVSENSITYVFKIFAIVFLLVKLYSIATTAYFDKGSRFQKTASLNSSLAAGVYTTANRATVLNTLLKELQHHVKKDDYLLAYDNIPLINYLTETKPYMGISWVWVYDSLTFDKKIREAEARIDSLPVVVQQKFKTIGSFSVPVLDYMSENKQENYIYKQNRVKSMNAFLKRNHYKIVWQNEYFNIYKPFFHKP